LGVKVDRRHAEVDEAREERLFHVGELLERHVLDDWRQLVMVANHDPSLQPVVAVLRVLHTDHTHRVNTANTTNSMYRKIKVLSKNMQFILSAAVVYRWTLVLGICPMKNHEQLLLAEKTHKFRQSHIQRTT